MRMMRRGLPLAIAVVLGVPAGALLAGCGSNTTTVSAAEAPPAANAETLTAKRTQPTTSTSTTPAQTTTSGGTGGPTTTRTAPEPAFTEKSSPSSSSSSSSSESEGLVAAVAALHAQGYSTADTSVYHPNQTLRVLVGTRNGSTDGYGQHAFFFVNGRYIGTDSKEPSASVRVVAQNETEVTLAYPLYRKGDPLSNPTGGQATVHFQLNDGKLVALNPIPPASSSSGTSRQ